SLFDRFVAYRESLGMEVLPLTGGAAPAEALARRLRSGRAVCLVADRDLSRNGVDVDFFGETARMPGGPALLAATTGAVLLPVALWFTPDGGWGQWIGAPIEPAGARLAEKGRAGTRGGSASGRRSVPGRRRWPTPSLSRSRHIPRIGTCCRSCGWRTCPSVPPHRTATDPDSPVRIGIVCPYSWDIPGGVQAHVRD